MKTARYPCPFNTMGLLHISRQKAIFMWRFNLNCGFNDVPVVCRHSWRVLIEIMFARWDVQWKIEMNSTLGMGILPDAENCGLRMRRECRERFPRHRRQRKPRVSDPGMHHGTCVTHVPRCMSGSLTRGGGENVPGIPGACATRNFTYLRRGPSVEQLSYVLMHHDFTNRSSMVYHWAVTVISNFVKLSICLMSIEVFQ